MSADLGGPKRETIETIEIIEIIEIIETFLSLSVSVTETEKFQ